MEVIELLFTGVKEQSFIRQYFIYLVCLSSPNDPYMHVLASKSWLGSFIYCSAAAPSELAVQGRGPSYAFIFCKSLCRITKPRIRTDLPDHILGASSTVLSLKGHEMQKLVAVCFPHCCWLYCHFSVAQDLCWAILRWHGPLGVRFLAH